MDEGWGEISAAVAEEHPELVFRRGFEVRMDVPDLAFDDSRIRLGDTSYILIEWPGMQVPPGTAEVVHHVRSRGLRPLIAHIERYSGRRDRVAQAREWRSRGALLQVNLGSLVGRHGSRARTVAFQLLRDGLVDVLATDFHGRPQYEIHIDTVSERLRKAGADEQLLLLTSTNPHRIIRDEETEIVPPMPVAGGLWGRLKDLFNVGPLAE
jgi:protein-tyrosine phosphatase